MWMFLLVLVVACIPRNLPILLFLVYFGSSFISPTSNLGCWLTRLLKSFRFFQLRFQVSLPCRARPIHPRGSLDSHCMLPIVYQLLLLIRLPFVVLYSFVSWAPGDFYRVLCVRFQECLYGSSKPLGIALAG
ncbi:hypothetical protein C8J55DRAFT_503873 [Lentinula edodes]|uniref:Uncharacterized protein n=1 Tax=Lentinula lateritia TaxID=40482 RepID=A0A9W9DYG5_9AGAR|nr:hypothetical protein C8J55DRAFT_503873 [Lentinula edodes]